MLGNSACNVGLTFCRQAGFFESLISSDISNFKDSTKSNFKLRTADNLIAVIGNKRRQRFIITWDTLF